MSIDENIACEACGRFGAMRTGDRWLCVDCYQGCGSCCPEFGQDDLCRFEDPVTKDQTARG